MVGASFGHPRIVNRLLDLQISAISQVADVNYGHQDLRVVTEIQLDLTESGCSSCSR
jgi:hypothetical protein